jgi:hypothetical protein
VTEHSGWLAGKGRIAFVALRHPEDRWAIYMIASTPIFSGAASPRHPHSLEWFRRHVIAMVETGGDPGHAPARSAYEASGFWLLPVARYFQSL